jgi:hypothetical protein
MRGVQEMVSSFVMPPLHQSRSERDTGLAEEGIEVVSCLRNSFQKSQ